MIKRFEKWINEVKNRGGMKQGSISLWIHLPQQVKSYSIFLQTQGVDFKTPGIHTADLVLSMKESVLVTWMEGNLSKDCLENGDLAWDGDVSLFAELGKRMSQEPSSVARSMFL